MTMGVLNKHDYKHELITLRQRKVCGIIQSIANLQFSNDKGKKLITYMIVIKKFIK